LLPAIEHDDDCESETSLQDEHESCLAEAWALKSGPVHRFPTPPETR
jgi:hypothetical protein